MKLEFQEYHPRKIVNLHRHVDGPWFWQQPAEDRYRLSRAMLEVVYESGFPLSQAVRATKEYGGKFVLGGGLTMAGEQAGRTLAAAERFDTSLPSCWEELYGSNEDGKLNHSPSRAYAARVGLQIRELCERFDLADRMPRYTGVGPLSINKRIAEKLFLKTYDLELAQASPQRVWDFRKAAWAVDEWRESLGMIYETQGEAGLRKLPSVGPSIASEIVSWVRVEVPEPVARQM